MGGLVRVLVEVGMERRLGEGRPSVACRIRSRVWRERQYWRAAAVP